MLKRLLFPRPQLQMSLRRQWQFLIRPNFAELTDEECRLLKADVEARLRHLGMLERIFDIGRHALLDIRDVLHTIEPEEPLVEEARKTIATSP